MAFHSGRRVCRVELVQLQQQAIDGAQLRVSQVLGVEQGIETLAPVGGRQNRTTQIAEQRGLHYATDVRNVLID